MGDAAIGPRLRVRVIGPKRSEEEMAQAAPPEWRPGVFWYSPEGEPGPGAEEEVLGIVELPGETDLTHTQAQLPATAEYRQDIPHAVLSRMSVGPLGASVASRVLVSASHMLDVAGHPSACTLGIALVEDFRAKGPASG